MNYSALQIDGLKEIINIGGGNAATSIAKLVDKKIEMQVPEVEILSYKTIYEQMLAETEEVTAVLSTVLGDLPGVFLFILTKRSASKMTEFLIGSDEYKKEVQESAITELANILTNSFLGAIGKLLKKEVISTSPHFYFDYFGAIISSIYMEMNQFDEQILIIRNEFRYDQESLEASLFFIPEPGVIEKILKIIGI